MHFKNTHKPHTQTFRNWSDMTPRSSCKFAHVDEKHLLEVNAGITREGHLGQVTHDRLRMMHSRGQVKASISRE